MNKTSAFMGLELRALKPYKVSIFILLGLALAMGYFFHSADTLVGYVLMMLVLMTSYPFSISERNNLDVLYATLSINRKTVVRGRYALMLAAEALGMAVSVLLSWFLNLFIDMGFQLEQVVFLACILFGVYSLLLSVQYPIYFKLGYNKAKLLVMIPMLVLFLVVIELPMLSKLLGLTLAWNDLSMPQGVPAWLYAAPLLAGLLFVGGSYRLSCRLYMAREL